jgi:hypothetical protein
MYLKAPCWFRVVGMVFLVSHFATMAALGFKSGPGTGPLGGSPQLQESVLKVRPDFNRAHYRLVTMYTRTNQKQLTDEHLAILKQIKREDAEAEEMATNQETRRYSKLQRGLTSFRYERWRR